MQSLRMCTCVLGRSLVVSRLPVSSSSQCRLASWSVFRALGCSRWTEKSSQYLQHQTSPYCTDVIPPPSVENQEIEYPIKIRNIVQEISNLTLIEVADLNELLKKTLNISDAPMMAMGTVAAAPAKDEDEEPAEKKQVKSAFTVRLTGFDDNKKVAVIKQIKTLISGMNLVQAKKFVESTPQTIRAEVTKQEAEELIKAVEAVGGKVEMD